MKITLILISLAWLAGCRTEIKGGESQHDKRVVSITYTTPAGGTLDVTDNSERTATTQQSVKAAGNLIPKIESASEGQIGGVSFTQIKSRYAAAWPLGLIFVGLAVVCWFVTKSILWTAGCGLTGIVIILQPVIVVTIAAVILLALVGYGIYTRRQLIFGVEAAKAGQHPGTADTINYHMASQHSAATQKIVKSVKKPIKKSIALTKAVIAGGGK